MKTLPRKSQFYLLGCANLPNQTANPSFLIPIKTTSTLKPKRLHEYPTTDAARPTLKYPIHKTQHTNKPLIIESSKRKDFSQDGYSRFVLVGAITVGFAVLLMGMEDQNKAWALGPEGPLMEEFWENVRRYALYALTVSTGALYTILLPIFELLKNPISAVLLLVILGGSFFIVSQILSAMGSHTTYLNILHTREQISSCTKQMKRITGMGNC